MFHFAFSDQISCLIKRTFILPEQSSPLLKDKQLQVPSSLHLPLSLPPQLFGQVTFPRTIVGRSVKRKILCTVTVVASNILPSLHFIGKKIVKDKFSERFLFPKPSVMERRINFTFSWVLDKKLGGMAKPSEYDLVALCNSDLNVGAIVTLLENPLAFKMNEIVPEYNKKVSQGEAPKLYHIPIVGSFHLKNNTRF